MVQFNVWGADARAKAQTATVMGVLVGVLQSIDGGTQFDEHVVGLGAEIFNALWLPDPTTDQARYIVTSTVTARALQAA